jgi:hypothetical protein
MPNRAAEGDFDRDMRYRKPAAWRRVKEMSLFCDALCREVETLCRDPQGPLNCPRECLYAALHHYALTMTRAQRMAAWMQMNRLRDGERIARGELSDHAQQCEPEYWETHTVADVVAEALATSLSPKTPNELRIIEKADYQPGDEPGSRCYWYLDVGQGILWLYRDTPASVRQEIVAEAQQRFAEYRREE